jgi:hypothetical protein
VFSISLSDVWVDGLPDNRFPRASRWGGYALYSEEGLGRGDLFIDMNRRAGYSPKVLVEQYWRYEDVPLYILTGEDLGKIKGYKRKILEDAFLFLYEKLW